jgi:hypothetical protein
VIKKFSEHLLEVELFPQEYPPRYTIKHIIYGEIKEIREDTIKCAKSKQLYAREEILWNKLESEIYVWHKSLKNYKITTVTLKHRSYYPNYVANSRTFGGKWITFVKVEREKQNIESVNINVNKTLILFEI